MIITARVVDFIPGNRGLDLTERFWQKVNKLGPIPDVDPTLGRCWLWTAGATKGGYGVFRSGHTTTTAHRVAFQMEVGEIPDGHQVDHKCFNPPCVRPSHLQVLTPKQNSANRKPKKR